MPSKLSEKINKSELLDNILKVFGSQRDAATKLNITEQNFSHKLKRLSNNFIKELESVGVTIPYIQKLKEPNVEYEAKVVFDANMESLLKTNAYIIEELNQLKTEFKIWKGATEELLQENAQLRAQFASLLELNRKKIINKINH